MITITKEMLASGQPLAQGEVLLWDKEYAPKEALSTMKKLGFTPLKLENDMLIVGHSESGHHHILQPIDDERIGDCVQAEVANDNNFMRLVVSKPVELKHLRGNDTHESFLLPAGDYIRRLREEYTIEGWRIVAD
jgi:hypothetical protein